MLDATIIAWNFTNGTINFLVFGVSKQGTYLDRLQRPTSKQTGKDITVLKNNRFHKWKGQQRQIVPAKTLLYITNNVQPCCVFRKTRKNLYIIMKQNVYLESLLCTKIMITSNQIFSILFGTNYYLIFLDKMKDKSVCQPSRNILHNACTQIHNYNKHGNLKDHYKFWTFCIITLITVLFGNSFNGFY